MFILIRGNERQMIGEEEKRKRERAKDRDREREASVFGVLSFH